MLRSHHFAMYQSFPRQAPIGEVGSRSCAVSFFFLDHSTAHTSGTPNLDCLMGIPAGSSASVRCSGNEKHAIAEVSISGTSPVRNVELLTLQIPQATVHSSFVAEA